jgi:hypothetical protein
MRILFSHGSYVVEKTDLKNRPLPFMDRGQKNPFRGMIGV